MRTLITVPTVLLAMAGLALAQCPSGGCRAPTVKKSKPKQKVTPKAKKPAPPKVGPAECPAGCKCPCAQRDDGCPCSDGEPCGDHEACQCRVAQLRAAPQVSQNFGIELDKLHPGRRYAINGREISGEQARDRLSAAHGATVPDDAAKPRLTVIGAPAQTAAVVKDLREDAALMPWRDRLLVQTYAPEHWAVARAGFVTTGAPTIYLQSPDGGVLHRQDDYAGGAAALADALRKADPLYRPERDRDRRLPDLLPSLPRVPCSAAALAAAAVMVLLPRRSKP